jgi:hypothetical protein
MDEAKIIALQWVRDRFPLWHSLPQRTIGALLHRPADGLLRHNRGWETFAEGLRQKLSDFPATEVTQFMRWLERQPLSILGG